MGVFGDFAGEHMFINSIQTKPQPRWELWLCTSTWHALDFILSKREVVVKKWQKSECDWTDPLLHFFFYIYRSFSTQFGFFSHCTVWLMSLWNEPNAATKVTWEHSHRSLAGWLSDVQRNSQEWTKRGRKASWQHTDCWFQTNRSSLETPQNCYRYFSQVATTWGLLLMRKVTLASRDVLLCFDLILVNSCLKCENTNSIPRQSR